MKLKYTYWPPTKKQFYFPQSVSFIELINDFYKPYKIKAKIGWYFFLNSKWIQKKLSVPENKIPIPLDLIKSVLSDHNIPFSHFLINLGTPGVEQKTSIIIIDNNFNKIAVIKLSQDDLPKSLIENESKWLSQIVSDSFNIPEFIFFEKKLDYNMLVFSYLNGIKLPNIECSYSIINLIKRIISLYEIRNNKGLIYTFAHGDFCPWNILIDSNSRYSIIDWELAGEYPLGYDLFTFIFQTFFLISRQSPHQLLSTHIDIITDFFKSYNIFDWKPYLKAFCSIKLSKENVKNQESLYNKYKKLNSMFL